MTADLTIVGLLVAGIGALFSALVKFMYDALKAKDAEISWLRAQLDQWTTIGRSAVTTAERLTEGSGQKVR
jgi:heme/copper-type cytochrome/quinol oxidase subunit 1